MAAGQRRVEVGQFLLSGAQPNALLRNHPNLLSQHLRHQLNDINLNYDQVNYPIFSKKKKFKINSFLIALKRNKNKKKLT